MVKRVLATLVLMLFPLMLCLNVWQSYRFQRLEEDLVRLQEQQMDLLEKNKRALAALAVYSSPSRVGELAEEGLGLKKIESGDVVHIERSGR